MAPIKFEENIKSKLGGRTIEPTPAAWERIEQQLDASDKKKKENKMAPWLVAASITAILIVAGTVFFGGSHKQPVENQWVTAPVSEEKREVQEKVINDEIIPEKVVEKTPVAGTYAAVQAVEKEDNASAKATKTSKNPLIQEPKQTESVTEAIAVTEPKTSEANGNTKVTEDSALQSALDAKVAQLLTEVEAMAKADKEVSQTDIDALLRGAQRELTQEPIFKTPSNELSALALLQEVEEEIDDSFRERVFDELSKRFNQAREAIASRNN